MLSKTENDRLTTFLYLLIRDEITVGVIANLCDQLPSVDESVVFHDKDLETLARQKVKIILEG